MLKALTGPKRILITDGTAQVAAKLWSPRNLAVVPCSVRHGPNKFDDYSLLQAVTSNDYAAYVNQIDIAMRRTACVHLARDLANCSTVVDIVTVIAEHQASTERVRKLKA